MANQKIEIASRIGSNGATTSGNSVIGTGVNRMPPAPEMNADGDTITVNLKDASILTDRSIKIDKARSSDEYRGQVIAFDAEGDVVSSAPNRRELAAKLPNIRSYAVYTAVD